MILGTIVPLVFTVRVVFWGLVVALWALAVILGGLSVGSCRDDNVDKAFTCSVDEVAKCVGVDH